MITPIAGNPFAVLTLIAARAVFTNASSVLALGTANRLARVVDRTRYIAREIHSSHAHDEITDLWVNHLSRLEKRGSLLVRAMSFFYGAIGAFAAASLVSLLGAVLGLSAYRLSFEAIAGIGLVAGTIGLVGLVVGCILLVRQTGWPCALCPTKPLWRKGGRKRSYFPGAKVDSRGIEGAAIPRDDGKSPCVIAMYIANSLGQLRLSRASPGDLVSVVTFS